MKVSKWDLKDKRQTAYRMKYLVNKYFNDLSAIRIPTYFGEKNLSELNLKEFYDYVRKIPYRKDTSPVEVVSRPRIIIKFRKNGMDCKKKAILIGAYLKFKRIPYRFIASSSKPNRRIHHVFPQVKINGDWRNIDATYNRYKMFEPKTVTKAEIL